MLGAIVGDIVGSVYEWHNIKTKEFPLFRDDCFFTDDTVMTCAVAHQILICCIGQSEAFFCQVAGKDNDSITVNVLLIKIKAQNLVQTPSAVFGVFPTNNTICRAGIMLKKIGENVCAEIAGCTREQNIIHAVVSDEDLFGELTEQVLSKYAEAIVSGISEALDDLAKEKGIDAENLSDEDIMEALDRWADEIIGKEMEILTTGQQAKELFLLSREIPQESDFSAKKENRSRSDAYRKLYHTRAKITMCLFSDFLEDKAAREEAIYTASPEELAEASAYVDGFYGLLPASDRRILDLLLDGKTQLEIAAELRISQSKVSKRRKHLQQILLEYDPDVKKILHLFKNNSQQME